MTEQQKNDAPEKKTGDWYVVNTYSGHERKVQADLLERKVSMGMQSYILQVIVAEEEVPVFTRDPETGNRLPKMVFEKDKDGKKTGKKVQKIETKNIYPGYVFVEMIMSDEAWFVVRNTPGVTGFVGSSGKRTKPFPIPKEQIDLVLKKIGLFDKEMYDETMLGEEVRVEKGPLAGSSGIVERVDVENKKVYVSLTIFGRVQQVELNFDDIQKA